jgi:hypothetical protein
MSIIGNGGGTNITCVENHATPALCPRPPSPSLAPWRSPARSPAHHRCRTCHGPRPLALPQQQSPPSPPVAALYTGGLSYPPPVFPFSSQNMFDFWIFKFSIFWCCCCCCSWYHYTRSAQREQILADRAKRQQTQFKINKKVNEKYSKSSGEGDKSVKSRRPSLLSLLIHHLFHPHPLSLLISGFPFCPTPAFPSLRPSPHTDTHTSAARSLARSSRIPPPARRTLPFPLPSPGEHRQQRPLEGRQTLKLQHGQAAVSDQLCHQ